MPSEQFRRHFAIFFIKDVLQSYGMDWRYLICLCSGRYGQGRDSGIVFFKGIAFLNNKP
ncbi:MULTISPECIES: hypothetical protein [Neisseria]|uniref:hypothetical protein n=1 Tax=Neisseria TaxID=482 RepID=UPI0027DF096A|nr:MULTISPECIES: hypothetical protein [Neisseria]